MIRTTYLYKNKSWNSTLDSTLDSKNTLVICFGSANKESVKLPLDEIYASFSQSIIIGCSTAGEIYQDELHEESLSVAVIQFEKSKIKLETKELGTSFESYETGIDIANNLFEKDLRGIFILSDGLNVNGSQLTKGINFILGNDDVVVTGGLAGDGPRFENTWVLLNNKQVSKYVTAVGFYGDNFHMAHGSEGGWVKFGIKRHITKSKDNVLYEIDDKPALEVYNTYLGLQAKDLPASGLYYPLMVQENEYTQYKIRTILAIDEKEQSITFAGDVPVDSEVMFMKASFQQLVNGAKDASTSEMMLKHNNEPALNIAVSCVGRKLVLGQKTEDELEAVVKNLDENTLQVGYYSYGEISPLSNGKCDLHNQTMTLSLIWETK